MTGSGATLSQFAEKLSRTPWLMGASDAEALRSIGLDDLSILHVIAVVAYQSAESRMAPSQALRAAIDRSWSRVALGIGSGLSST